MSTYAWTDSDSYIEALERYLEDWGDCDCNCGKAGCTDSENRIEATRKWKANNVLMVKVQIRRKYKGKWDSWSNASMKSSNPIVVLLKAQAGRAHSTSVCLKHPGGDYTRTEYRLPYHL